MLPKQKVGFEGIKIRRNFALNDVTVFEKKHILLVDDVLTTDLPWKRALALMESSFVKISVFHGTGEVTGIQKGE